MFSFVGASLHVHDTSDDSTAKNAPASFYYPGLFSLPNLSKPGSFGTNSFITGQEYLWHGH